MDHWRQIVDSFPFIGLMASDQRNRPYVTRLLEQATPGILVGLMVAGLGVWRSDSIQDERIKNNTERITKVNTDIDELKKDMNYRFDRLDKKLGDYQLDYRPLPNYQSKRK